jgi:hypothetical protein
MLVKVFTHGFFVYPSQGNELDAVKRFAMRFAQMETVKDPRTGHTHETIKAVHCTYKEDLTEFGFLIRAFNEFQEYWNANVGISLDIKYHTAKDGVMIPLKMLSHFMPRGQQPEAIDYATQDGRSDVTLEAATGFGKTISGFFAMERLGTRTAAVMSATHITTWINCGTEYMAMRPGEVLVIKSAAALKAVIANAKQGLLVAKFLLFSSETIRSYIKEYESMEGSTFPCSPVELWSILGVGFVIRDESHEAIHASIRQVIYSHVKRIMFLSATLVSDDQFINKMYTYIFGSPGERWKSEANRHISVRPLFHMTNRTLLRNRKLRSDGPRGYSHVNYEKSILKNKRLLKEYINFIDQTLRSSFLKDWEPGLKAIVLCSTVKMCETLKQYFKTKYPNMTWGGFYDGAKPAELYERDVVIGTPKGAGTGKDIPGLSVLIQTIAVNSVQLNLQIMGRLRPIKLNGKLLERDPLYIYFVNSDIRKHVEYHKKRLMDIRGKCKDVKPIYTNFVFGQHID